MMLLSFRGISRRADIDSEADAVDSGRVAPAGLMAFPNVTLSRRVNLATSEIQVQRTFSVAARPIDAANASFVSASPRLGDSP
jgi:hypothetical protein